MSTDPAPEGATPDPDNNDPQEAPTAEPTPDDQPGAGEEPESAKLRREAATYRRRLRDAEAHADSLGGRVETMQRREVERLAAAELATPGDLWLTGTTSVADLLDDDGDVDAGKVEALVSTVLADRPGWRRNTVPSFDGGARTPMQTATTYQEILRGGKR